MYRYTSITLIIAFSVSTTGFCKDLEIEKDAIENTTISLTSNNSLPKDASLQIDGSFRLKFDNKDNFNIKKIETGVADRFVTYRTRIGLKKTVDSRLSFYGEIQDARETGWALSKNDFPAMCPVINYVDMRQLYFDVHFSGSPWSLRGGRQILKYGDGRVFAPGDGGYAGRYQWHGLKVSMKGRKKRVTDFFRGKRVEPDPDSLDNRHFPYWVYSVYSRAKKKGPDYFWVYKDDSETTFTGENGTGNSQRHSIGSHINGSHKKLSYSSTALIQTGDYGGDSVDAFAFHINTTWSFGEKSSVPVKLAFDASIASGDKDPADGRNNTFDFLFGGLGKYYGKMNLTAWMNLRDWQFSVMPTLKKSKVRFQLDFHRFELYSSSDGWYKCNALTTHAMDPSGQSGDYIGRELDIRAFHKTRKNLYLEAGFCWFVPGSFANMQGLGSRSKYQYIEATIRF